MKSYPIHHRRPLSAESSRAAENAWRHWEAWCAERSYEPLGYRVPLAEYVRWLVEPSEGGFSHARALQAYWAIRRAQLDAHWRDPSLFEENREALAEIRTAKSKTPSARYSRDDIEEMVGSIDPTSIRGLRDRALLWLAWEGHLRPGQLVALRWRHVAFGDFDAQVKVMGKSPRSTRTVMLHEGEEPLEALREWRDVRQRRNDEPVFVSIPANDRRVSSVALSTRDVTRIVSRRSVGAGLGSSSARSLSRPKYE